MNTIVGESGYARKELDAYWTEKWVTEWLLAVPTPLSGLGYDDVIWESACGAGWISDVLLEHGFNVLSTDIKDYGYEKMQGVVDFLSIEEVDPRVRVIMTNPPYDIEGVEGVPAITAEKFVRRALEIMKPVNGQVIMLLRNEFDCANGRRDLFGGYPFSDKYVLTKRPRWIEKSKGDSGPRHNYSWFVWDWASDPQNESAFVTYLYGSTKPDGSPGDQPTPAEAVKFEKVWDGSKYVAVQT
ncbi:MAG: hypothetical protein KJZ83_00210 [Burkholderiaceae bacterium]|nr:hypothetical protein [Burkholderiaceae bacterium]